MRIYENNFKVLAISGDDIRNMGGGEKTLLRLCDTINMDILSINKPGGNDGVARIKSQCSIMYVRTLRMSALGLYVPVGLFSLNRLRDARAYSCLISFHSNIFSMLFTIIINRLEKKPLVHFLHDPTVFATGKTKFRVYRKIQLSLIKYIPDIHVELPQQVAFLKDIGFSGRIHQFPFYFPVELDEKLLKPKENFIVLFTGRIEIKQKGIDLLTTIIRNVILSGIIVEFHIIGSDYGGGTLIRRIENEFPGRVKYLGRVSEDELQREYRESSLFISTSRYETLGLSILEAMNYGIKIIYFDVPGPGSIVDDESSGIGIKPFDTDMFSRAICETYEYWRKEPDKFHSEVINRIKKFRERFKSDSVEDKIRNMLELAQRS
jgi:glycosyltransferase involved in cell wall biosynthesis